MNAHTATFSLKPRLPQVGLTAFWSRTAPLLGYGALLLGMWIIPRWVFFSGISGFDDLDHIDYAAHLDRPPANHWETRLLYNALLHVSIGFFGRNDLAFALPSLLGSLLTLFSTFWLSCRIGGKWAGLFAVAAVATIPIDVVFCTTAIGQPLAVGLASAGTAILVCRRGLGGSFAAVILLSASMSAHPTTAFYMLALAAGFGLAHPERRERIRIAACAAGAIVLFITADFAVFAWLTGDPLYEMRLLSGFSVERTKDPQVETFSRDWFLYPLISFLVSKDFGVLVVGSLSAAWLLRKRLDRRVLTLALTCLLMWIWIGYGSRKPTGFEPFWRTTRFDYPIAMALCAVFGCIAGSLSSRMRFIAALPISLNLLLLAMGGSWTQGTRISRDFLGYVQSNAHIVFVTDKQTLREMGIYAVNGEPPPNVAVYRGAGASADEWSAPRVFLWNPANLPSLPERLLGGVPVHTFPARFRLAAQLLPSRLVDGRSVFYMRPAAHALHIEYP